MDNDNNLEINNNRDNLLDNVAKIKTYVSRILKSKLRIIVINTVILILTIVYFIFISKSYYKSGVTILPEYGSKSSTLSQLSSLAAMAGVNVGDKASTEIYQNLISSESVLTPVIYSKYYSQEFEDSVNLIEYFEVEPDESLSPELQKRKMFISTYESMVKTVVTTNVDRLTKILTLEVTLEESSLAAEVANNIVKSLDDYIRTQRKSYASEQRYYIEKRVKEVSDSLTLAENKLNEFRNQNRIILQSPSLQLEQGRLIRDVEILQTVYVELTKQLELAKIDEVKDTPVVNLREEAKDPVIKAGPKRVQALIIIMFLSFAASLLYYAFLPEIKKYIELFRTK